jgi:CspA family cold shock protein
MLCNRRIQTQSYGDLSFLEKPKVDFGRRTPYIRIVDIAMIFVIARWQRALDKPPSQNRVSIRHAYASRPFNIAMRGFVMTTGTVKWFNSTKGFGFIQPDNGDADVFVHISAVERAGMREIVEGQKLGYELERDTKSGKMSAGQLRAA